MHHEASLRPKSGPAYSAMMRDRQAKADKPKRTLKMLDEEKEGVGKMAMMASGIVTGVGVGGLAAKGKFGGFVSVFVFRRVGLHYCPRGLFVGSILICLSFVSICRNLHPRRTSTKPPDFHETNCSICCSLFSTSTSTGV